MLAYRGPLCDKGHRHLAGHGQAMVQEASLGKNNSSMNLELVLLADWVVTLMVVGHPGDQIFPTERHFLRYLSGIQL